MTKVPVTPMLTVSACHPLNVELSEEVDQPTDHGLVRQ
jgi:hypothetical protein